MIDIDKVHLKKSEYEKIIGVLTIKLEEIRCNYKFSRTFYASVYNIVICISESFTLQFEEVSACHTEFFHFAEILIKNFETCNFALRQSGKSPNSSDSPLVKWIKDEVRNTKGKLMDRLTSYRSNLEKYCTDPSMMGKIDEITSKKRILVEQNKERLAEMKALLKAFQSDDPSELLNQFEAVIKGNSQVEKMLEKTDLLTTEIIMCNFQNKFVSTLNACLQIVFGNFKEYEKLLFNYFNILNEINRSLKIELELIYTSIVLEKLSNISEKLIRDSLDPKELFKMNLAEMNRYCRILYDLCEEVKSPKKAQFSDEDGLPIMIEKTKNLVELSERLMESLPQEIDFRKSELFKYVFECNYDPGFFSSWSPCVVIFSRQNNILVYDEKIENLIKKLPLKKVGIVQYEAVKKPCRIELAFTKKSSYFSSSESIYIETKNLEERDQIICYLQAEQMFELTE